MNREKLIGYVRVSSAGQAEYGQSLDAQTAAINGWGKANGYTIIAIYADAGLSGTLPIDERPALARALKESSQCSGLIVYDSSRLARDFMLQELIFQDLRKLGKLLVSVTEGIFDQSNDDPSRTLIRQILGALAQYEREKLRARIRLGVNQKRNAGGYVGGTPPYGYKVHNRELIPNTTEQVTLQCMISLRKSGKHWQEIADTLNAEGLTTRHGRLWLARNVGRILTRIGYGMSWLVEAHYE